MHGETRHPRERLSSASDPSIIDGLCDRFEQQWKAGERPELERYLAEASADQRAGLLKELLLIEIEYRVLGGERVELEEYRKRFPQDQDAIDSAWQLVTVEYEPYTATNTRQSSSCQPERNTVKTVPEPVLDGRQRSPRRDWSLEEAVGPAAAQDTLVMRSELTNLQYYARGGLGVVCLAEDPSLHRVMAVKFIRRQLALMPECRERLRLEAEITSRLEHPGVVPVYGMGETDSGRLFYAMRLIQGDTLDDAIRQYHAKTPSHGTAERHVELRKLLTHFTAVCKTVAYANNRGIVHRDIKPANVMLGRYGETVLVDWGLALAVGREGVFKQSAEHTLTPGSGSGSRDSRQSGAGTPAYMSPEQAAFSADLDQRSDIYSLGATLYQMIAGRAPFEGKWDDIRHRVIRGDFPLPTRVNKHAPKALEAVCLKAMALTPNDRYPTALDLAGDVEAYLADAAVGAFDEPLTRRLARWARRHWGVFQGLLGGLVLFTIAVLAAALMMGRAAQREGALKEKESYLKTVAEKSQANEHALRKQGLSTSAKFAARTIANQVDIRWRILEKMAAVPYLHEVLAQINQDPSAETAWEPLQKWLEDQAREHELLGARAFFINTADGTQVARSPSHLDGERFPSLGDNFNYRDYFHGRGKDYYDEKDVRRPPLELPHNGAVHESTNGGDLAVVFSVPIRPAKGLPPIGVLGMAVNLGSFTSLEVDLPAGQQVMLVDTRLYYLERQYPERHRERGEGLVLHHEGMGDLRERSRLPHIDDDALERMLNYKEMSDATAEDRQVDNLIEDGFRDPVSGTAGTRTLAAFAPVVVKTRPAEFRDTGWFLIVQQAQ